MLVVSARRFRRPEVAAGPDRGESSQSESSAAVQGQTIAHAASGVIHIEFGRVRMRIEGSADAAALRVILEYLLR